MSKWLCLFFKILNFSAVQSASSCNLGKVIHDSSLRHSYLLQSLGVSLEFSAMAAFWQTPCSRLIYSLPYPRALQKNHFLGGNEASGNPLRCFGSVPGIKGMSQPGAVRHFPSGSELSLEFGFCKERITDMLGSSFLFMFRLWVALWSALLCLPEPTFPRKVIKENASSFCNFILIN